jgi:hypothetical protein
MTLDDFLVRYTSVVLLEYHLWRGARALRWPLLHCWNASLLSCSLLGVESLVSLSAYLSYAFSWRRAVLLALIVVEVLELLVKLC